LGVRKSIRPVKIERRGFGVVVCLERGADCLHMVQLTPLHPKTAEEEEVPVTGAYLSCFFLTGKAHMMTYFVQMCSHVFDDDVVVAVL